MTRRPYSIIRDRFFPRGTERIAIAFFRTDEFRTDDAILFAVEEYECPSRPAGRFEVRVMQELFEFGRHGFGATARLALQSSPAVSLKETEPPIVSPFTLPVNVIVTGLPL